MKFNDHTIIMVFTQIYEMQGDMLDCCRKSNLSLVSCSYSPKWPEYLNPACITNINCIFLIENVLSIYADRRLKE